MPQGLTDFPYAWQSDMPLSRCTNNRLMPLFANARQFAALLILAVIGLVVGCNDTGPPRTGSDVSSHSIDRSVSSTVTRNIVAFCGDCHPMPDPGDFPRQAWRDEVRRGFDFYYASGRTDLAVPIKSDVLEYFTSKAPEYLSLPAAEPVDTAWAKGFDQHQITIPGIDDAAVSFVGVVDAGVALGRGIVFTDMQGGGVYFCKVSADGEVSMPIEIGNAGHPAAVRVSDWDQDGLVDFLVADLGSFLPADHKRGRVVWFQQRSDRPGQFHTHILQDEIGRVASIEVADFNGDSQLDLLVAEFGWQSTGSIFWLQRSSTGHPLEGLVKHTIDSRAGAIHLPVVDLNGDGAPDFIALISQHHERIEAMINDGMGNFQSELIYAAPSPSYGSSGIELVDIDGNGRIDVLYTNGDSFDSFLLKPVHGVKWLENRGEYPFTLHELGVMPGAHRAVIGDVDGDGQKEIVAGAFIPHELLKAQRPQGAEALVVWKQSDNGQFSKHVVSHDNSTHAALTVADLNGDGRDDLVIGNFRQGGGTAGAAITVWIAKALGTD